MILQEKGFGKSFFNFFYCGGLCGNRIRTNAVSVDAYSKNRSLRTSADARRSSVKPLMLNNTYTIVRVSLCHSTAGAFCSSCVSTFMPTGPAQNLHSRRTSRSDDSEMPTTSISWDLSHQRPTRSRMPGSFSSAESFHSLSRQIYSYTKLT